MADHDQCPWCKGWGHDGMDCAYVRRSLSKREAQALPDALTSWLQR